MKTEIIKMLELPRKIVRGNVPLETCEHAGNFSSSAPECRICETRLECEWLYHITIKAYPGPGLASRAASTTNDARMH